MKTASKAVRASRRKFLKAAGVGAGMAAVSSGPLIFVRHAVAADRS